MSAATVTAPTSKKFTTVPLNWKEVWYTNCPLVSSSNIDQGARLDPRAIQEDRRQVPTSSETCARTTCTRTTSTTSTTSSASRHVPRPFTFMQTSAGPGSWG